MARLVSFPLLSFPLLLLAATAVSAQSPAPSATPVSDLGGSVLQLFLGLAGAIAIIIGSLWLLKKLVAQRGPGANLMRVVAGTAVGTRERVVIIEVGSTWLVLGVAPGRVSALAEIPRQSLPPAADVPGAGGFQEWLRRMKQGKN